MSKTAFDTQHRADPLAIKPSPGAPKPLTTDDPRFGDLWGASRIKAEAAWQFGTGAGVTVAVVDTGVDYGHADLDANIWRNTGEIAGNGIDDDLNGFVDDVHGYDFVNGDGDPFDDEGHGTHVAGTIAAERDNGIGIVGIAPNAKIMPVKVLSASGTGTNAALADGIRYATDNGADVINLSLGGSSFSSAVYNAIVHAAQQGVVVVAAAGNDGSNIDVFPEYPASLELSNIISVAATTSSDGLASFSNYGFTDVDIGAPGSGILSTLPGSIYGYASGTSMAAPHIAAVAALVIEARPAATVDEITSAILATAEPLASLDGRVATGGLVDALAAVQGADGPWVPPAPPGDDYAGGRHTTGRLSVDDSATGNLENAGDRDWFAITLTAGAHYRFDLTGIGLSDPYLRLYDTSGRYLTFDDDGGPWFDSRLSFTADASGLFFLEAGAWDDRYTGTYRLSATQITGPGTTPADDYAGAPTTAGGIAIDGSATGTIETGGDTDWFAATLEAGQEYRVSLSAAAYGGLSDPVLRVVDAGGTVIAADDGDGTGTDATLMLRPLVRGTVYVTAQGATAADLGSYTLGVHRAPGPQTGDIVGGPGADTLSGTGQSDVLRGLDGADRLFGYGDADVLDGGSGADRMTGGAGDDLYYVDDIGDTIGEAALGGTDTVVASVPFTLSAGFGEVENLILAGTASIGATGNALDNSLTGNAGDNVLRGAEGDDHLDGHGGADRLDGGPGTDLALYRHSDQGLTADLSYTQFNTGEAAGDTYVSIENLEGTDYGDSLRGNAVANQIVGGGGGDALHGRGGDDVILGGDGADFLWGNAGADRLDGGADTDRAMYTTSRSGIVADLQTPRHNAGDAGGDIFVSIEDLSGTGHADSLRGDTSGNRIAAGGGDDRVHGRAGDDRLLGQDGDDVLWGNAGADYLSGGSGIDRAQYTMSATGIVADLLLPQHNTGVAAGDTYSSIENLWGTLDTDSLRGDNGPNAIWAAGGNDAVHGRAGDDTLRGQDGNDLLWGGAGADTLLGGAGTDRAQYTYAPGGVRADLLDPATNTGEAAGDRYTSIEDLGGSAHDDILAGDDQGNRIWGGGGQDRLSGRGGDDLLLGGDGADTFVFDGSPGTDTIGDWTDGADRIQFAGAGTPTGLSDLTIAAQAGNTVVSWATGAVVLRTTAVTEIDGSDFLFGP